MKRYLIVALIIATSAALLVGGSSVGAAATAPAASGHAGHEGRSAPARKRHSHIGFYRKHRNQPIALLRHLAMDRYLMASDTGAAFEMTGIFNAAFEKAAKKQGVRYTGSGVVLAGIGESMCEDCGGNHPVLHTACSRCQQGTVASCSSPYGSPYYYTCYCYCPPNSVCLWIRGSG